jgi:hypothetical protein
MQNVLVGLHINVRITPMDDLKNLTRKDFHSLSEINQFIEFTIEENTHNPTKY